MGNKLKNRVAVVTGSGRGIGEAIAIAMAMESASVVTNDCEPGIAEATVRQIKNTGGQAISFTGDISKFDVAHELIQAAVDKFGSVDILVNNAGVFAPQPIYDMTEEDWDRCVEVSLKGSFNCIRHACGLMKNQRWGRIINATSTAWLNAPGYCNYGAAKAGIVGLTRAVAREVGKYGVTCNAYAPTAATRMLHSEGIKAFFIRSYEAGLYTKEHYEGLINPPSPEAIAPLIVYLSTDEAADINGQVFHVLGGHIGIYSEPVEEKALLKEDGLWTLGELIELVPKVLLEGYKNPAPVQPPE